MRSASKSTNVGAMPSSHHAGVRAAVDALEPELVELRRDLHAHPELAWQEERTTAKVADRLSAAGIDVQLLPKSGLIAEVGTGTARWSRSGPTWTRSRSTT